LSRKLAGKKAIVTAGPTYEPLDPVRFIGNHSSGKMGVAIARALHDRGAEVILITGPVSVPLPSNGIAVVKIAVVKVTTAAEMYKACEERFEKTDIAIMAAAVADYAPAQKSPEKIKKAGREMNVELVRTPDILKSLGERKRAGQVLVGFALETNNEEQFAREKLQKKNADLIVLNSLNDAGAGFGGDSNKVTIFGKQGEKFQYDAKSKTEVARDIVDKIIQLHYA
jgi:phosphopantothenoylcysteine decarboxylase/phosphopantothenate--cysteine ligase